MSGYLVPAGTADAIAAGLARHMDELAADGEHADRMSVAARSQAQAWRWPTLTVDWMDKIQARAKAFGEARS